MGVGRGGDPAYWHLVRSGHSWQRGRLALHTSAPKSSTAEPDLEAALPAHQTESERVQPTFGPLRRRLN